MVWMAGTYLAPGTEVCNTYKYMPNDKAMLQYGFLQVGACVCGGGGGGSIGVRCVWSLLQLGEPAAVHWHRCA
jgi:hypothetical protein